MRGSPQATRTLQRLVSCPTGLRWTKDSVHPAIFRSTQCQLNVIVPARGRADFEGMKISYQERLFYQAESFSLFPDEFLPQQEDYLADKVREAVEALPQRQREFILSFYFEGRSYTQVALRLGVTIKKAEKLHQEAKSRLKALLSPMLEGLNHAQA